MIPSGKLIYIAIENGHLWSSMVDLPGKNGDVFHSYVSLPEGNAMNS